MTADINGLSVYYEQVGEGKPLLLLHGWMCKTDVWAPILRDFRDTHRITAIDFPGQGGRTPEPPEAWSVTEHMEMVAALIKKLHMEGTDIIAHSFGGRVSILLAATYPELVGKLILTGSAGLIPKSTGKKKMKTRIYRALRGVADGPIGKLLGEKAAEGLREQLRQVFGSADYKALKPSMRGTFNRVVTQDLEPCLKNVKASTLLIWGRNDFETPLWMGETMEKAIPDAGLVVLENAGHYAYLDQYAQFQTIARRFIG